jgi:UDP-3-O-[3-hydroxymyristoyl] glucosamine N-acyltransferase
MLRPRAGQLLRELLQRRALHVHASAVVHPSATIEPGAVVQSGARVGAGATICANAVVGDGVLVGEDVHVGPHVSLLNCEVGRGSILHAGVRVGQDGFGFLHVEGGGAAAAVAAVAAAGAREGGAAVPPVVRKKPQTLRVVIGSDVEIGANSCVDRGSWRDTVIGDGSKLDNLVQVGHNAAVGRGCLLCAMSALGGSSTLGDGVVMGGKAAVADHVSVAARVRIAACSGVTKDIPETAEGTDFAGFPAQPAGQWRRQVAAARRRERR